MTKRNHNPTNYVFLNQTWTPEGSLTPNSIVFEKCANVKESYSKTRNYYYNDGTYQWTDNTSMSSNDKSLGIIFDSSCGK